jgi:hypothetical protein
MSVAWAAVIVSVITLIGALGMALIRSGRAEGRLETILDRLVDVSEDHETRLRVVENRR